jgi:aryl-alcohol dehydrogenase-like predicted oxidoreductase
MTMETRPLGRTGEEVSVLGYGAMELRGQRSGPVVDDEVAGRLLNLVLDGGINIIDTSIDYGRSEELIGRYVSHRRNEFILATKCGCPLDDVPTETRTPIPHDYREKNIRAGVEQSLRRLNTDRLDVVQVHGSPSREQMETDHTIATLLSLRDEGKIRFIGMSGVLPHLRDHLDMGVFDVFQIPYSALQREHEDIVTAAAAQGAGTLIRGGVARGAPAEEGGWTRDPLLLGPGEAQRRWESSGVEKLMGDMSRMEFVLRFTISHPGLSTTIVGTSSIEHLNANLACAERGPLPAELYTEAKRLLDASVVVEPRR